MRHSSLRCCGPHDRRCRASAKLWAGAAHSVGPPGALGTSVRSWETRGPPGRVTKHVHGRRQEHVRALGLCFQRDSAPNALLELHVEGRPARRRHRKRRGSACADPAWPVHHPKARHLQSRVVCCLVEIVDRRIRATVHLRDLLLEGHRGDELFWRGGAEHRIGGRPRGGGRVVGAGDDKPEEGE